MCVCIVSVCEFEFVCVCVCVCVLVDFGVSMRVWVDASLYVKYPIHVFSW